MEEVLVCRLRPKETAQTETTATLETSRNDLCPAEVRKAAFSTFTTKERSRGTQSPSRETEEKPRRSTTQLKSSGPDRAGRTAGGGDTARRDLDREPGTRSRGCMWRAKELSERRWGLRSSKLPQTRPREVSDGSPTPRGTPSKAPRDSPGCG